MISVIIIIIVGIVVIMNDSKNVEKQQPNDNVNKPINNNDKVKSLKEVITIKKENNLRLYIKYVDEHKGVSENKGIDIVL